MADGFAPEELREQLERHVDAGLVPRMLVVLARHDDVHVEAAGRLAFEGAGSATPMAADTICRVASMTEPIAAAGAMTLVDDGALLSPPSLTLLTGDHLTPAQKAVSGFRPGYFDTFGRGFGMSVRTHRTALGQSAGTYGSSGLSGTAWYNDPAEDLTTIVMMQRAHLGDQTLPQREDVWPVVHQTIGA